jgi:nucleoside-diphosphate-sugar epimerase
MRIFLTGATGFVGTAVARELIAAGHQVLGQARSDAAAQTLAQRGIDVHRGDLEDPASFVAGAQACDGVVHTAFIHDFSRFAENMAIEQRAVVAMLDALEGSNKPLIITSGVALLAPGTVVTEATPAARQGRGETEHLVLEAAQRGIRTSVVRLPPTTHGDGDHGFTPRLIEIAREKGVAAYISDGANCWAAGHRLDAARIYRLALEKGEPGGVYHAIGDEGVPTRDIAAVIGRRLGVPVVSKTPEEAGEHFGWLGAFFGLDVRASSALTQAKLRWRPQQPGLIADLDRPAYFEAPVAA